MFYMPQFHLSVEICWCYKIVFIIFRDIYNNQRFFITTYINYLINWGLIIWHKFKSYHYLHHNDIWLKHHSFGTHCCLVCFVKTKAEQILWNIEAVREKRCICCTIIHFVYSIWFGTALLQLWACVRFTSTQSGHLEEPANSPAVQKKERSFSVRMIKTPDVAILLVQEPFCFSATRGQRKAH